MEVDGVRMEDEGEKLDVETKSEDTSELIWNLIEGVLGKSFFEIDLEENAFRYTFQNQKKEEVEMPIEAAKAESFTLNRNSQTELKIDADLSTKPKKWWEFWR